MLVTNVPALHSAFASPSADHPVLCSSYSDCGALKQRIEAGQQNLSSSSRSNYRVNHTVIFWGLFSKALLAEQESVFPWMAGFCDVGEDIVLVQPRS